MERREEFYKDKKYANSIEKMDKIRENEKIFSIADSYKLNRDSKKLYPKYMDVYF